MNTIISIATTQDIPEIQKIYAYYVKNTAISFDYTVPSIDLMTREMQQIHSQNLPYLVAKDTQTNQIIGFAYAMPFSTKQAYAYTCTLSIYVTPHSTAKGVGQQLYQSLEAILIKLGIIQLLAIITSDNITSIEFHLRNGFIQIGEFPNSGYKFDKWHSICWLSKNINPLDTPTKKTHL